MKYRVVYHKIKLNNNNLKIRILIQFKLKHKISIQIFKILQRQFNNNTLSLLNLLYYFINV